MFKKLFLLTALVFTEVTSQVCNNNGCINLTVAAGTGCAWMCTYCATNLGTNNYYFTDNVCVYQPGGCIGNPVAGKMYTCCAV